MDPRAWSSDRALPLGRALRAITMHFPQFRSAHARALGEGWNHEALELARTWVFRFPKRREVQYQLTRERAVLIRLQGVLPVTIPNFKYLGWPSEFFPYIYAGYLKLPGEPLQEHTAAKLSKKGEQRLARQLGKFLSALHAVKLPSLGVAVPAPVDPFAPQRRTTARLLRHLAAEDDLLSQRLERHLASATYPFPKSSSAVLTHGDLDTDHILIDPERESLAAIMDWGDVKVARAASDFAGIYGFRGRGFLEMVLDHYRGPVGAEDLPWIANRSIYVALRSVAYGRLTHKPAYVVSGIEGIRRVLHLAPR